MGRFWRYIWSLRVPHEVRHFTWRACKDILPTKANLKRRKVLLDGCCDACQTMEETSGHLFWEFTRTQEVWALTKLFPPNHSAFFPSFLDLLWFGVMVKCWDPGDVEKAVMVAWALWTNRNEVRHGKKRKAGMAIVYGAMDYLLEYQNCLDSPVCPAISSPALWSSSLSTLKEFNKVDVSHEKRAGNRPAHLLAKYAIGINDVAVWVEESPSFILQALLQDVTFAASLQ